MVELTAEQRQVLQERILDLNDQLETQTSNLAGQAFFNAFRLGCAVLAVPLVVVLVIFIVLGKFDASSVLVLSCAGTFAAVVFGALVAMRAKTLAVADNYQYDIGPEIARVLSEHHFTRRQFDDLANEVLEKNTPLRQYLMQPTSPEEDTHA